MTVIWSQRDIEMTYTMFHLMENGFSGVAVAFFAVVRRSFHGDNFPSLSSYDI